AAVAGGERGDMRAVAVLIIRCAVVVDEILLGDDAYIAARRAPCAERFMAVPDARIEHGDADACAVETGRGLIAHEVCARRGRDVTERALLAVGRDERDLFE